MFVLAPPSTKKALVAHLMSDPAGSYLIRKYMGEQIIVELCLLVLHSCFAAVGLLRGLFTGRHPSGSAFIVPGPAVIPMFAGRGEGMEQLQQPTSQAAATAVLIAALSLAEKIPPTELP
jgi:hypothetical protein